MNRIFQRSGAAFAALLGAAISLRATAADGALPPERQAGVSSYISGGIGEGESQRFDRTLADHRVHVTDSGHAKTTFVFQQNAG